MVNPLKSQTAARRALVVITGISFLLRAPTLARQSLWRDEVDAIRFSSWTIGQLGAGLFQAGHNGPLYFLLLRPWRSLTGDSEFALRYPSALLGVLLTPLGFVLARQMGFSRRVGLLLGLLLATSPYLVWYSQEAKMYTLLAAMITLAFIAYLKALTGAPLARAAPDDGRLRRRPQAGGSGRWWAIFIAATSLSFYTHILAPLMLMVYAVVALLHYAHLRRRWRGWSISMACLTLPYIPLALWQLPLLLNGFQSGHPFYALHRQTFLLLQLYSSGLIHLIGLTALVPFVFLFLSGLFLAERGPHQRSQRRFLAASGPKNRRTAAGEGNPGRVIEPAGSGSRPRLGLNAANRLSLAAWVLLPPLAVYLISLRVAVFEDRYLIYLTLPFYLLIGLGLVLVRQHRRWPASLALGLILIINLMGIWQQQRQPIKPDFRGAAAHLAAQSPAPQAIMIQIPYLQYTLAYYYPVDHTLLEGLWTNDGKSEAAVDDEMMALTAGLTDLWLVVSEEELWDQRQLTRAWLNQNAELVEEVHFVRVDLYYYQLQPNPVEKQSIGTLLK